MVNRQGAIAQVLGVTDAWHLGPSPSWPLVVVVIDEAHTFFHERKGTAPEVKAPTTPSSTNCPGWSRS
jgi:DNA segregation ATPase FtsK/SpoIIIE, S-DNA-T family